MTVKSRHAAFGGWASLKGAIRQFPLRWERRESAANFATWPAPQPSADLCTSN
jgi:hypothetical protein